MVKISLPAHFEPGPVRLDALLLRELRRQLSQFPRSLLKKWFQEKRIQEKPSLLIVPGRISTIQLEGFEQLAEIQAFLEVHQLKVDESDVKSSILYEDEKFLVFNKPSGLPSSFQVTKNCDTAVHWAVTHCSALRHIFSAPDFGLLHRLDNETSGVLVFAKTRSSFEESKLLWKTTAVRKIYRALCSEGATRVEFPMKHFPLTLRGLIARHPQSRKKMLLLPELSKSGKFPLKFRGKPMKAESKVLAFHRTQHGTPKDLEIQDLEVEISTGVMHQIRVQLSGINLPILGDQLYGGLPFSRLCLHAWRIFLDFPGQSHRLMFEAPLPQAWL